MLIHLQQRVPGGKNRLLTAPSCLDCPLLVELGRGNVPVHRYVHIIRGVRLRFRV